MMSSKKEIKDIFIFKSYLWDHKILQLNIDNSNVISQQKMYAKIIYNYDKQFQIKLKD